VNDEAVCALDPHVQADDDVQPSFQRKNLFLLYQGMHQLLGVPFHYPLCITQDESAFVRPCQRGQKLGFGLVETPLLLFCRWRHISSRITNPYKRTEKGNGKMGEPVQRQGDGFVPVLCRLKVEMHQTTSKQVKADEIDKFLFITALGRNTVLDSKLRGRPNSNPSLSAMHRTVHGSAPRYHIVHGSAIAVRQWP
jgi:hypothetical protein